MQNLQIIRSQRKTISIEIRPDGSVLVRAPMRTGAARIEALLREKKSWIDQKLAQAAQAENQAPQHRFQTGELFPYLGRWYPLELVARTRPLLHLDQTFRLANQAQPEARKIFTNWYRQEAARTFATQTNLWAQATGLTPTRLSLSSARTRWGSCGPGGSINLTWRLVMAPLGAIDYVIVHELVHLKVKNHSKTFWNEVQKHLPNYQLQRDWLKENGHRLDL